LQVLQFWSLGVPLYEMVGRHQRPSSPVGPVRVVTGRHTQEMVSSSQCRRLGVPLHVEALTPARLEAAGRSGARFGSAHVHLSATEQWPQPSDTPSGIVSALAGSAATLTALHGLPLVKPPAGGDPVWAAFTELRDLSLRQTWRQMDVLRATELPASLQDLKLVMNIAEYIEIEIEINTPGRSPGVI